MWLYESQILADLYSDVEIGFRFTLEKQSAGTKVWMAMNENGHEMSRLCVPILSVYDILVPKINF